MSQNMDSDQASQSSLSRPRPPHRHSSSTNLQNARPSGQHHVVGARGGARVRNASSKNLTKLGKAAGAKVAMPRNTSKTNLRKNQSETSLQLRQRQRTSSSPSKDAQGSTSVTRRSSDTTQPAIQSSSQQGEPSGSSIPEGVTVTSFGSARHNMMPSAKPKGKKRRSKDLSATKAKHGDRTFEFDGEEEFDDEAWEDERTERTFPALDEPQTSETVLSDAVEQAEQRNAYGTGEGEDRDESAAAGTGSVPQDSSLDAVTELPEQRRAEKEFKVAFRESEKPPEAPGARVSFASGTNGNKEDQHASTAGRGAYRANNANLQSGANAEEVHSKRTSIKFDSAVKQGPVRPEAARKASSDEAKGESDSDSSPDTVVLTPSTHKTPPSVLKPSKANTPLPQVSRDTSPTLIMRSSKKVQIEEPEYNAEEDDEDGDDESSTSSTPAESAGLEMSTASLRPNRSSSSVLEMRSRNSNINDSQYEFLSKAQRDKASLLQETHPYPPSVWRDQFLIRATPYVNDFGDQYTQKFIRRLDRRIDDRLSSVVVSQDVLLESLCRAQDRGVLSSPEQQQQQRGASTPQPNSQYAESTASKASGIQGWFSRFGGAARKEEQTRSAKELQADRLERWAAMLERHEWRMSQPHEDDGAVGPNDGDD